MHVFIKLSIDPTQIVSLTNTSLGSQDDSVPKPKNPEVLLDLFKSRYLSGLIIYLGAQLHWYSKRQMITTYSSIETEIYATDEYCKSLAHILILSWFIMILKHQ